SLGSLAIGKTPFMLNGIHIESSAVVSFSSLQQQNVRTLVRRLSTQQTSVSTLNVRVLLNAPLISGPFTIRSSLFLYKDIALGEDLLTVLLAASGVAPNIQPSLQFSPTDLAAGQAALLSNFNADQVSTLQGLGPVVIKSLDVSMNDNGVSLGSTIAFVNPVPLDVAALDRLSALVAIEGVPFLKLSLRQLSLNQSVNQNFNVRLDALFIDKAIDQGAVPGAIQRAMAKYASTGSFNIGLVGPFEIANAGFISEITHDLNASVPFAAIQSQIPSLNVSSLLSSLNITSLLSETLSGITISAVGSSFQAAIDVKVPELSSLKLPPQISIPFETKLSLLANSTKLLGLDIKPVSVRSQNHQIQIKTSVLLTPSISGSSLGALLQLGLSLLSPTSSTVS
ncbi:hypothetical protein HDU91_003180, partial [Kappamyces sp. JEL0680]